MAANRGSENLKKNSKTRSVLTYSNKLHHFAPPKISIGYGPDEKRLFL